METEVTKILNQGLWIVAGDKEFLKSKDVFRLDSQMIFRRKSVVIAVNSKVLV